MGRRPGLSATLKNKIVDKILRASRLILEVIMQDWQRVLLLQNLGFFTFIIGFLLCAIFGILSKKKWFRCFFILGLILVFVGFILNLIYEPPNWLVKYYL